MSANDFTRQLLTERRRRAVAECMTSLESTSAWRTLSDAERKSVRSDVIRGINSYHDIVLDILKVFNDGTVIINETALEMIRDIHAQAAR